MNHCRSSLPIPQPAVHQVRGTGSTTGRSGGGWTLFNTTQNPVQNFYRWHVRYQAYRYKPIRHQYSDTALVSSWHLHHIPLPQLLQVQLIGMQFLPSGADTCDLRSATRRFTITPTTNCHITTCCCRWCTSRCSSDLHIQQRSGCSHNLGSICD